MAEKMTKRPVITNNIESTRPNIPQTPADLVGYFANSCNGGHDKAFFYKDVMAGEYHRSFRLKLHIKLLTPKTPVYQPLKATIIAAFCPDSAVWKNAEKFQTQKGGATETKITEMPNLGGKNIPTAGNVVLEENKIYRYLLSDNTSWRDCYISTYIPRIGPRKIVISDNNAAGMGNLFGTLPKINALHLRQNRKIWNHLLRNKEYDAEEQEFDGDTVTEAEWTSYMPDLGGAKRNTRRARRDNCYYTDYRTELQGFETPIPDTSNPQDAAINWATFESKISEARTQAANANKTDEEIISELFGSPKLDEGRPSILGVKTFYLNYSAVTQNTYNNNEQIEEEFRVMGEQGGYSYTNVEIPIYSNARFKEFGTVHFFLRVTADSIYEQTFDRMDLNVNVLDRYRPDLVDDKKDILYKIEMGTGNVTSVEDYAETVGFKRKFNEYYKMPTTIGGDLCTNDWIQWEYNTTNKPVEVRTKKTYQFFENDPEKFATINGKIINKNIWQDYTDILINKNLAIPFEPITHDKITGVEFKGQNQIDFMGTAICQAILPINKDVTDNFTEYGEH